LVGKVTIIKSLILPLFTHLFISLPNPPLTVIKNLETMFYSFIWKGKRDKIQRATMICDYDEGGLKMIHLESFITYLKTTWIKRALLTTCVRTEIFERNFSKWGSSDMFYLSKHQLQSLLSYVKNPFWKDVFSSWASVKDAISDPHIFLSQGLVSYVHPDEVSAYKRWKQYNVTYVNDFFSERGEIHQFHDFVEKYHVPTNFMQYYKVVNRFPRKLVRYIKENNLHLDRVPHDALVEKVIGSAQMRFIHSLIVSRQKCISKRKIEKWSHELGETFSLIEVFTLSHVCSVESQVRKFHLLTII